MDRRSYLKLAGAAVASVVAAGVVGTASAEKRHDTIVNMVEAGADPSGETPIDPVLARVAGDDTLLVFPEGEYLLAEFRRDDLANFGMVAPAGATLVAPVGTQGDWLELRGGRDLTIRGLAFETPPATDPRITIRPDDGLDLRDAAVTGWHAPSPGPRLVVGLGTSDARGTIDGLRFDGSLARESPSIRLVVGSSPAERGLYRLAVDGTLDGGAEAAAGVVSGEPAVHEFSGSVDRLTLAGRTTVDCRPTR